MSNQHTINHNEAFTLSGSYKNNPHFEAIVQDRDLLIDNAAIAPVPWKQFHRANVPHLSRHSG